MRAEDFIRSIGASFYTGVPDSLLKPFIDCIINTYGMDEKHHIIAANEGSCTAIAAGYHLATGKTPVVYMQNSGIGNAVNPVASLLSDKVYAIPVLFVVGWRGEPGIHDEPQHLFQGEATLKLLEDMDISFYVVDKGTTGEELKDVMSGFRELFALGKSAAFVVRKGVLTCDKKVGYENDHLMQREDIIKHIIATTGGDPVISTTGKASRELFEARENRGEGHEKDFLTVGSMGHASSIALSVAINKPDKKVWCIDGDGAAIMHMGAMAVIGSLAPKNLVHIVINNEAHETVGGMPTAAGKVSLAGIARECGYKRILLPGEFYEFDEMLKEAKAAKELTFMEIKSAIDSRADLGRPTTTAADNKKAFMDYLAKP